MPSLTGDSGSWAPSAPFVESFVGSALEAAAVVACCPGGACTTSPLNYFSPCGKAASVGLGR